MSAINSQYHMFIFGKQIDTYTTFSQSGKKSGNKLKSII